MGEQGLAFGEIAAAVVEGLGVPARSIDPAETAKHFGNALVATLHGTDVPDFREPTRELLDSHPDHWTLLEDLRDGDHLRARARRPRGRGCRSSPPELAAAQSWSSEA